MKRTKLDDVLDRCIEKINNATTEDKQDMLKVYNEYANIKDENPIQFIFPIDGVNNDLRR